MNAVTVNGQWFIKDGKRWPYVGVDCFPLLPRWLMHDGPHALVDPLLDDWRSLYDGEIVLRAFCCAAPPNAFAIDPWSYPMSAITDVTQHCNARGFAVEWTRGDWQAFGLPASGPTGPQEHTNQLCAALVPTTGNFIQTCNEWFKNGIDVSSVIPPQWGAYLRNSGAYGDTAHGLTDFQAVLDYVGYHPDRGDGPPSGWPKFSWDLTATAAELRRVIPCPIVFDEPIGCADTMQSGKRSNNPDHFAHLGSMVLWVAGVTFHCDCGMNGSVLTPTQRDCARAFFAAAKGARR